MNIILSVVFTAISFSQPGIIDTGFHFNILRVKGNDSIPGWLKGKFTDDYRINYTITDSLWMQLPTTQFHIIKWNLDEQYLIAKNDKNNPGEGGLYTRIDYTQFKGMEPFGWGFCLTAYQAKDAEAAEHTPPADRSNPKKGCGGFPFSRMKRK